MNLLKKAFIKDYQSTHKPEVRFRYGIVAGVIGIILNLILFAGKVIVGIIGNSITVIADAINNLSDAGSSIVTVFGFKISSRPADEDHPFGYQRIEYITALIVAIIVLAIGVLLGKSSIEKIITPEDISVSVWTYVVLGGAMLVKLMQMFIYRDFAKAIDSDALMAGSQDSRNDVISTGAVLIASIIIHTTGVNIDGYMGLIISLFIVISAIKLIKETCHPLIGEKPSHELVKKIKDKLMSYEGVEGIHDLMIHNYGATTSFVIVHVEVSASQDILVAHDLMDNIERDFKTELGIHLSIHMDPIETDNEEVATNKARCASILYELNNKLTLHDFRMVFGASHTNILFDVVVPYSEKITKAEIEKALSDAYKDEEKKYFFVISIDKDFA